MMSDIQDVWAMEAAQASPAHVYISESLALKRRLSFGTDIIVLLCLPSACHALINNPELTAYFWLSFLSECTRPDRIVLRAVSITRRPDLLGRALQTQVA